MVNPKQIFSVEDSHLAPTYEKMPIAISKGKGPLVWDINGKEYIDCMGGYGVALVGHSNPKVIDAVKRQAEKLLTCHSSIYNEARAELLEKLMKIAPKNLEMVYLANSGAEAVECAIKLAIKHTGRKGLVAMMGSYHGKTLGALAVTWNPKYRESFTEILPTSFKFTPYGNLDKAKEAIDENTAAVIVEPIQGESGIHPAPEGFLKGLEEICKDRGALLIVDEIQSGLGRTGRMWALEHWGVEPDIICVAKGLGGGIPIGATLAKRDIMMSFKVGDHTSTFGGNPIACAAASATLDFIITERLPERAKQIGRMLKDGLKELAKEHRIVREVRGLGLMLGMELRFDVKNILLKGLEDGLIFLYAGRNVLRFLPPLVIEEEHIAKVLEKLDKLLSMEEKARGLV